MKVLLSFLAVFLTSGWLLAESDFKFAWPDSAEAVVKERIDQPGTDMQLSYKLLVTRRADGSYVLERKDPQPIALNGKPVLPGLKVPPKFYEMLTGMGKTVTYVVDSRGNLKEIPNFKEMVDALAEFPSQMPWADDKSRGIADRVAQIYTSASGKKMAFSLATMDWKSWIGVWRGFDAPEGGSKEVAVHGALPLASDVAIDWAIKYSRMAAPPQNAKLIHAKAEYSIDDPKFVDGVKEVVGKLNPEGVHQMNFDEIVGITCKYNFESYLDPVTALPYWVKMESGLVGSDGQIDSKGHHFREYIFDWKKK